MYCFLSHPFVDFLNANPWALALAIFLARITDVSLGTVRTILLFRGYQWMSAIIGFFEVLVWILAAGHVLHNLHEWYLILSYAGGFATGNMVGIWLESKMAMGNEIIQVISEDLKIPLAKKLREQGYHVTEILAKTEHQVPVEIVLLVEKRRTTPKVLQYIHSIDPEAFYTIESVKGIHEGHRLRHQKIETSPWWGFLKRK